MWEFSSDNIPKFNSVIPEFMLIPITLLIDIDKKLNKNTAIHLTTKA